MGLVSDARSERDTRERVCYFNNRRSHLKSIRSNLNVLCLKGRLDYAKDAKETINSSRLKWFVTHPRSASF
jgi:hypothetical protein